MLSSSVSRSVRRRRFATCSDCPADSGCCRATPASQSRLATTSLSAVSVDGSQQSGANAESRRVVYLGAHGAVSDQSSANSGRSAVIAHPIGRRSSASYERPNRSFAMDYVVPSAGLQTELFSMKTTDQPSAFSLQSPAFSFQRKITPLLSLSRLEASHRAPTNRQPSVSRTNTGSSEGRGLKADD